MAQMGSYPPLNETEYAESFATFISACSEYKEVSQVLVLAKPVINSLEGKPVKMLSIGAGTGRLETSFINDLGLKLSFYYAVEPTTAHRAKLEKAIASWGDIPHEINPCCFTPEFTTEHRFDFVMMSHSLYCMREWRKILGNIHTLLAPGGKFILFHQAMDMCPAEEFVKHATIVPLPIQENTVTVKQIKEELEARNIKKRMTVEPGTLQVHNFMEGQENGTATHVVDFLLQTLYKNLNRELKSIIKKFVEDRSTKGEDGLYRMSHPTAMFLIEN